MLAVCYFSVHVQINKMIYCLLTHVTCVNISFQLLRYTYFDCETKVCGLINDKTRNSKNLIKATGVKLVTSIHVVHLKKLNSKHKDLRIREDVDMTFFAKKRTIMLFH